MIEKVIFEKKKEGRFFACELCARRKLFSTVFIVAGTYLRCLMTSGVARAAFYLQNGFAASRHYVLITFVIKFRPFHGPASGEWHERGAHSRARILYSSA